MESTGGLTSFMDRDIFIKPFQVDIEENLGEEEATSFSPEQSFILEKELKDTYWKANFRTAKLGLCNSRQAILLALSFDFHASKPQKHRFTWAKITLALESPSVGTNSEISKFLKFSPRYAVATPSQSKSSVSWEWNVEFPIWDSAKTGAKRGGELVTETSQYPIIQGSTRGSPETRLVWTITENKQGGQGQRGLPAFFEPAMIIQLNADFYLKLYVEAKVSWSWYNRELILERLSPVKYESDKIRFSVNQLEEALQSNNEMLDEIDLLSMTSFADAGKKPFY